MADDNVDIFKFSGSGKVKLGHRKPGAPRSKVPVFTGRVPSLASTIHSSDSDGAEDSAASQRKPSQRVMKSAASRLLKRSKKDVHSSDDSDDDVEFIGSSKRMKQTARDSHTPSPSPPRCTSPLPSPPPPGSGILGVPSNDKSRHALNQANDVLHRLWHATPSAESTASEYHTDLIDLASSTPPTGQSMNLRVRYRGKVRKYPISRFDAFSNVIKLLAKEQKEVSEDKVLLSHKATTIRPTDSPGSLGLTTADIIDAVIMTESANSYPVDCEDADSSNAITIKVQTSSLSKKYSIGSGDPLRKVMVAFASELDISLKNLKFLFDGSIVEEAQTPLELDMEDDDCIDVAVRE